MNDQVIIAVANAITAQAETLKALIDALPKETKIAVEKKVSKATTSSAPVASVETPTAPVIAASVVPVVETTTAPVVNAVMPAPPFPTQQVAPAPAVATTPAQVVAPTVAAAPPIPAAVAQPAVASPSNVPFHDSKTMMKFVMDSYQALGSEKGAKIQDVLISLGTRNINDVQPEHYAALYAGIEALKG